MSPAVLRRVVWSALATVLMVVTVGALWTRLGLEPLPDYGQVPAFELTESSGTAVTREQLEGEAWVADFIFTRCAGTCPMLTSRMASIQERLPAGSGTRLVSITVDPEHDTPDVLAGYAARYAADPQRWLFLTGGKQEIYGWIRDGFHLGVGDARDDGDATESPEPFIHSTRLVLVDAGGRIRGYYDAVEEDAVDRLLADLDRLEH